MEPRYEHEVRVSLRWFAQMKPSEADALAYLIKRAYQGYFGFPTKQALQWFSCIGLRYWRWLLLKLQKRGMIELYRCDEHRTIGALNLEKIVEVTK